MEACETRNRDSRGDCNSATSVKLEDDPSDVLSLGPWFVGSRALTSMRIWARYVGASSEMTPPGDFELVNENMSYGPTSLLLNMKISTLGMIIKLPKYLMLGGALSEVTNNMLEPCQSSPPSPSPLH